MAVPAPATQAQKEEVMTIEQIKQECRKAIELSEKATDGPWSFCPWEDEHGKQSHSFCNVSEPGVIDIVNEDGQHIAHARTFAPAAAKALLMAVEALEQIDFEGVTESAIDALDGICARFEQ